MLEKLSSPPPQPPEKIPEVRPVEKAPCPVDLAGLDGALKMLVDYMLATARRPQPVLAVGASLCALGALMGRKYRTESNLRSNLYVVGIADSGSGKNHSREVITELFVEAGLGHALGGNKIASGAGLLTAVHRQPAILFQIDEFGMFLSAAADRKRSPRHISEILDIMTEIYTMAGTIFLGAEYANRDGKNERRDINQPCLCVYGTTTPIHFWNALQSSNVVDGSLARFIVFQSEDDYPEENEAAGIRTSPPELLDALKLIASGGGRQPAGNLAGMTPGPETAVDPLTVPMTPEARSLFRAFKHDNTAKLREARGTLYTAILARIAENAWKVAMIRAVAADPVAPVHPRRRRRVGDRPRPPLRRSHHGRGRAQRRRQPGRGQPQAGARHHPRRRRLRADQERPRPPDPVPRQAAARRRHRDARRVRADRHRDARVGHRPAMIFRVVPE